MEVIYLKNAMIRLSTVNDVKNFISISSKYDFDIDVLSGRYIIDAKSIMGLFSLDLSQPICVQTSTNNSDQFFKDIQEFIIKE